MCASISMSLKLFMVLCIAGVPLLHLQTAKADEATERTPSHTPWPDTFLARVEALALIQTLNADLLSHDSATLTLERWCGSHHLATPARVVAARVSGVDKAPTEQQREELHIAADEAIRYRHVRLMCGALVLSEADNWYVPGRLSPDMNKALDTSDIPFGKVVLALHFQRHTLSSTLLWLPLPEGWEMDANTAKKSVGLLFLPASVLEHRAVLTLPDGMPFSEVVETYTGHVLDFNPPSR
jgi:hypothetical protein